jgi:hypothetical protein
MTGDRRHVRSTALDRAALQLAARGLRDVPGASAAVIALRAAAGAETMPIAAHDRLRAICHQVAGTPLLGGATDLSPAIAAGLAQTAAELLQRERLPAVIERDLRRCARRALTSLRGSIERAAGGSPPACHDVIAGRRLDRFIRVMARIPDALPIA